MKYTHNCDIYINEGGTVHMMNTHTHLGKHIPHHERKALIHIDFSADDMTLFKHIYGDEDAPPEIQILAAQLISLIKEVAQYEY